MDPILQLEKSGESKGILEFLEPVSIKAGERLRTECFRSRAARC